MPSRLMIIVPTLLLLASSCQKQLKNPGNTSSNYDIDAATFMDSSGITASPEKNAINNLVIQLKDSSLWQKFVAIYPMVGGTAHSTSYNLKDPRDADAAYRLTFYGAPSYSSDGVLFPTISDYADTHLEDNALGGYANSAISYYSGTQNDISGYDIGCTDGAAPFNELSIYSNSADNSEWFGFSQPILSPNTTGLFMLSSSQVNVTRYRNGEIVSSKGSGPKENYTNLTFLIGKSRVTVHPGQKKCQLTTLGNGLTDSEALTFYHIVQKFESSLGR